MVASDVTSYDVSVKVGDTIYRSALHATPRRNHPRNMQRGHELLVLVGKNTITYNDMLGRSFDVPIESQKPATEPKHSK